MSSNSLSKFIKTPLIVATLAIIALAECSSSDSDETTGYVIFYNASANAPSIYLTVDEDIENDDSADHVERTYYSVAFGQSSGVMAIAPAVKTYKLL
ncbi:MAG: hypothetical protein HRU25_00295 [Psychrobium sp.]|nr:hypothetical protein [Psychrobium sp.]